MEQDVQVERAKKDHVPGIKELAATLDESETFVEAVLEATLIPISACQSQPKMEFVFGELEMNVIFKCISIKL